MKECICHVKIIFTDKTDSLRIKLETFCRESGNIKEQVNVFYFKTFQQAAIFCFGSIVRIFIQLEFKLIHGH